MQKYYLLILYILLSFLITNCSISNATNPKLFNNNTSNKVNIKIKWERNTDYNNSLRNSNLSPAYFNNIVFVPNSNGMVYALSIKSGDIIWKTNTNLNLSNQPNTIANAVIVGSIKGTINALDSKTGKILWISQAPSSLLAQITIHNNYIYTHTHDGSVSAFNSKDGKREWNISNNIPQLTLNANSSPIVINDTVMIGSSFGEILSFEIQSGKKIMNIPISISNGSTPVDKMVDIIANPIVYQNYLIFATYQGNIVALDKYSNKILWSKKASIINDMDIYNNVIFTTQNESEIKAYNIKNGETVWTQDVLKLNKITAPIYYKGLIVVADYQGYLHFFNSLNGEYFSKYKLTPNSIFFQNIGISAKLIPTTNGIIIEDDKGKIYLIDAYSDKVIYESIIGDYKVDKGNVVTHIKSSVKQLQEVKKSNTRDVKDNLIRDLSKGKTTDV